MIKVFFLQKCQLNIHTCMNTKTFVYMGGYIFQKRAAYCMVVCIKIRSGKKIKKKKCMKQPNPYVHILLCILQYKYERDNGNNIYW